MQKIYILLYLFFKIQLFICYLSQEMTQCTHSLKIEQQWGCIAFPIDSDNKDINPTPLPLTKITYDVQIVNGIAEVSLNQTYINKGTTFLELQYRFPVKPNSCIYKFVAIFSKVRMQGIVKQKQNAVIQYNEAVKIGKKAALGIVDQKSKDILTLQIGNLGPGQQVKIQIIYTQELTISLNTFYQFNLVTNHTPRYINTMPSQDYVNSFRKSAKTVGGDFQWDFKIRLRTSRKIVQYKSVSHSLALEHKNNQDTQVHLTIDKGQIFSKAFSFIFTTQDFQIPSFVLGRSDAGSSVMVSFIPKFCNLSIQDAKIASFQGKNFQTELDQARGEYIFVLDRSGSMDGQPIEKAKQALILFLKSLPIDTYFQVVSFGSNSQYLFPTSQKNGNQSISQAIAKISPISADMGGTQILEPLERIFNQPVIQGYSRQIFLLTDGGVSDTQNVINLVRKNVKYSRVHTIGLGNGVSQALITGCAQKGKGQHIFIRDGQDPSQKIIQLLNQSLTPLISKVNIQYDKDIIDSIVPNPDKIPYILKGDVVNFYLTFKGQLTNQTNISLSYVDSLNNLPYKSQISILPNSTTEPFVDKLANYRKIKALEQAEENNGNVQDYVYFVKITNKKQEIINLSIKNQILSKYTAFLCVQKQLVDGKYEQIQKTGVEKIKITTVLPQQPILVQQACCYMSMPMSYVKCAMAQQEYQDQCVQMCYASCQAQQQMDYGQIKYQAFQPRQCLIQREQSCQKSIQQPKINNNITNQKKNIKDIIKQQFFEGYWSNQKIIQQLYGNQAAEFIQTLSNKQIGVTYLIVAWIEKNHPEKQYSLIVKKARSWLKKQSQFVAISTLLEKYVK